MKIKLNKIKDLIRFLVGNIYARLVILDRASKEIKLSYGLISSRVNGGYLHGGQVKTYNLKKKYPEFRWRFNCIYLVSSALPFYIPYACLILKKRGFKIILNQNGVAYPAWSSNVERINAGLRKVFRAADVVIYQSHFAKKSCNKWLGSTNALERFAYNPVDLQSFKPLAKKKSIDSLKILSASSFQSMEGINLIIDAATLLKGLNYKWQISGKFLWKDGESEVRAAINSSGLDNYIHIGGVYNREQAPYLFSGADIFVHLNTSMDVCPTSVIEALSSGLPVVGFNSGGMPELVCDKSGLLISYEGSNNYLFRSTPSPELISGGIKKIISNLDYYSANARNRAEVLFDQEKWLHDHELIFKELMSLEMVCQNV